jgi:type IV pilus assembly protein PilE
MRSSRGFSLIELLVVIVIVGVLAKISITFYTQNATKTRRADGRAALHSVASRLERCNTQYGSYNDAACTVSATSNQGLYTVAVTRTATSYSIVATPVKTDANCTTLTLNNLGVTGATGAAPTSCW